MKTNTSYFFFKRLLDVCIALVAGIVLLPVSAAVALGVKFTSEGPILFWSNRIGRNNEVFKMPKFRTMNIDTPTIATHLLQEPKSHLTSVGRFLRKASLDEIPQLWSVIVGNMSLVGPRPALNDQHELVKLRSEVGIHKLRPGITGWAQINGRDELSIPDKVAFDNEYLKKMGYIFDLKILYGTFLVVIKCKSISH